jgi:hypothetical protein
MKYLYDNHSYSADHFNDDDGPLVVYNHNLGTSVLGYVLLNDRHVCPFVPWLISSTRVQNKD